MITQFHSFTTPFRFSKTEKTYIGLHTSTQSTYIRTERSQLHFSIGILNIFLTGLVRNQVKDGCDYWNSPYTSWNQFSRAANRPQELTVLKYIIQLCWQADDFIWIYAYLVRGSFFVQFPLYQMWNSECRYLLTHEEVGK